MLSVQTSGHRPRQIGNFEPKQNNFMTKKKIAAGAVHKIPADLKQALSSTPKARAAWKDITPLARNEWICWITSGKKMETRSIRIKKTLSKLKQGMRRPCCWAGCPHRS